MHKFWFFLLCLFLCTPLTVGAGEYKTNDRTEEQLGPCPSYRNGMEIGYAFAEPFGAVQLVDVNTREKNRSYAEQLVVTLRIVNRNFFYDRLESISTPIANQAGLKKVRVYYKDADFGVSPDYTKYISPFEELVIPGARLSGGDSIGNDDDFLTVVELQKQDIFIHVQDIQQKIYYGDMIPMQLSFMNAGTITVYTQLRARREIDNKYRFKIPFPSCS